MTHHLPLPPAYHAYAALDHSVGQTLDFLARYTVSLEHARLHRLNYGIPDVADEPAIQAACHCLFATATLLTDDDTLPPILAAGEASDLAAITQHTLAVLHWAALRIGACPDCFSAAGCENYCPRLRDEVHP